MFTSSVKDRYQLNYLISIKDFNTHTTTSFKIKFVLFLYLLLSASWKENDLSWCISVIRQTVGFGTEHQYLLSRFLDVCILQLLIIYRIYDYDDVVTVIAQVPEVVCLTFQTSRYEKDGTWSELTWFDPNHIENYFPNFYLFTI